MFAHRRVLKVQQVGLLRQHLPTTIKLLGAFDDSGNYALDSRDPESAVGPAILAALRREDRLRDLGEVSVAPEPVVRRALDELVTRLRLEYGNDWNASTYGVRREGTLWRAGLAFGSDGEALELPESGLGGKPNVIIISRREGIVAFLKKENFKGETRISFGDPTRMVDQASRVHLGRRIATTSRSARTVAGVLRCF